jgi:hypothetical protein
MTVNNETVASAASVVDEARNALGWISDPSIESDSSSSK